MKKGMVSIMMLNKNRAHFLKDAINSVIDQAYQDWELLIIDNDSSDDSLDIIRDYARADARIKLYSSKLSGIAVNRNYALSLAAGEYIAVLDSDDLWIDKLKLNKQVSFLDANPDYGIVGGLAVFIDEAGHVLHKNNYNFFSDQEIRKNLLNSNPFVHSSVVYRLTDVINLGLYREAKDSFLAEAEDYDLYLKFGLRFKLKIEPEYYVKYRSHPGNSGYGKSWLVTKRTVATVTPYLFKYPNFLGNSLIIAKRLCSEYYKHLFLKD